MKNSSHTTVNKVSSVRPRTSREIAKSNRQIILSQKKSDKRDMMAVAAAQKNREMFAIKKSYSIEVSPYKTSNNVFERKYNVKIVRSLKEI